MKLRSKYRFAQVHGLHCQQFAESSGLSLAQTRLRILRTAAQLPAIAGRLQAGEAYRQEPLVGDIVMLIEQRCALSLRSLTPG